MIWARLSFPTGVFRACTNRSIVFCSSSLSSRNRSAILSLSLLACLSLSQSIPYLADAPLSVELTSTEKLCDITFHKQPNMEDFFSTQDLDKKQRYIGNRIREILGDHDISDKAVIEVFSTAKIFHSNTDLQRSIHNFSIT